LSTLTTVGLLLVLAGGIWWLAGMPTTIEGFTSGIQGIPDKISGLLGGLGGGSSANYAAGYPNFASMTPAQRQAFINQQRQRYMNRGVTMHQQYQYPSPHSMQMQRMMQQTGPIYPSGGSRQI
jgi:hypothetical protein